MRSNNKFLEPRKKLFLKVFLCSHVFLLLIFIVLKRSMDPLITVIHVTMWQLFPWLLGYSDLLLTNNGNETLSQKKGKTNKQTNKLRLQEILNMCALQVDVLKLEVTTLWGAARLLCLVSVQIYTINNKIKLTGFGSLFCLHR